MGALETKEKILKVALDLFNDKGTKVISTNHIAKVCNMSPGNLYYHYANKAHIILALLELMIGSWDEQSETHTFSFAEQTERTFANTWKYRFLHRELVSLFHADAAFKAICIPVLQQRCGEISVFLEQMGKHGVLKPMQQQTNDFLSQTILFMALFWLPYLEVTGQESSEKNIKLGAQMMGQLLQPYFQGGVHV